MPQPEVFGSGMTAMKGDSRRMLLAKRVTALSGSPAKSDTCRMLRGKIVQAKASITQRNNF